jgi:hypothetical protein
VVYDVLERSFPVIRRDVFGFSLARYVDRIEHASVVDAL